MRAALSMAAAVALAAAACSRPAPKTVSTTPVVPAAVTHLLVTVTPSWEATKGTMTRYVRAGDGWEPVGAPIDVVVGRAGLGWGRGLHGSGVETVGAYHDGPPKKEGDGRSPAGAFWIRGAYGYEKDAPRGATLPWAQIDESWRCVDDPRDGRYNEVFDAEGIQQTWASAEEMRRPDDLYKYVVYVAHNDGPQRRPEGGSCIFLHVWGGPDSSTVGCTAMDEKTLVDVIRWIAPDKTAYVALPEDAYAALAPSWGLPPGP